MMSSDEEKVKELIATMTRNFVFNIWVSSRDSDSGA